MADIYVWSGGSDSTPYGSWAAATTSFITALAAAANGDVIRVQYNDTGLGTYSTTTSMPCTASNALFISVDKTNSDAYTPMGTTGHIGHSTSSIGMSLYVTGTGVLFKGLTFRNGGTTGTRHLTFYGNGGECTYENCYFYSGTTGASAHIAINAAADSNSHITLIEPTFYFAATTPSIVFGGRVEIYGGSIAADSAEITDVFEPPYSADATGASLLAVGFNCSEANTSANLCGAGTIVPSQVKLHQCILPATYELLATQTEPNRSNAEIELIHCKAGTTEGIMAHANGLGRMVSEGTILFDTDTRSWKITTTTAVNAYAPYRTPWIWGPAPTGASITPRIEVVRTDSTTAHTDAVLWGEFLAASGSGTPIPTRLNGAMALFGSPASVPTGAGLGSWANEGGTAWSGKLEGGAVTPTNGELLSRLNFAASEKVIYMSQKVRW